MPPRIPIRAVKQLLSKPHLEHERYSLSLYTSARLRQQLQLACPKAYRNFSTSPSLLKKGAKANKEAVTEGKNEAEVENPFDFSTLESGLKDVHERLERGLQKLRTGGRFNPEILESVRVQLNKESKTTIRLGELAQVLPKGGRSVMVLVGEADHVKPIISAIQSSPELNLQPQTDAHNSLQLNIPIPPPTKESRDKAIADAHKVGETAYVGVRNVRAAIQKKLRSMELKKTARPDDLKKAHKEMEKLVEKGNADVKKIVDAARKMMEQS